MDVKVLYKCMRQKINEKCLLIALSNRCSKEFLSLVGLDKMRKNLRQNHLAKTPFNVTIQNLVSSFHMYFRGHIWSKTFTYINISSISRGNVFDDQNNSIVILSSILFSYPYPYKYTFVEKCNFFYLFVYSIS